MPELKSNERAVVEMASGGRLTISEFSRISGLSRMTVRNWANNPKKKKALELMIRGAAGCAHEQE